MKGLDYDSRESLINEVMVYAHQADASSYDTIMKHYKNLEDRIIVLEALTRGMRLPEELDVAGQTYVRKQQA